MVRDRVDALAEPHRKLVHQESRQYRNIFVSLSQRRQSNGKNIQAIIEVFPKGLLTNRLEQIAVGGGHDANIDLDRRRAAHAIEFPLLQDAKQFHLCFVGDFANLIQENGAAVSQLKTADTTSDGVCEGALLVTEQFAFHQPRREGRAVYLDQRLVPAFAGGMNRAGDKFLARTGFAGD